jgi:hypothetical protein
MKANKVFKEAMEVCEADRRCKLRKFRIFSMGKWKKNVKRVNRKAERVFEQNFFSFKVKVSLRNSGFSYSKQIPCTVNVRLSRLPSHLD